MFNTIPTVYILYYPSGIAAALGAAPTTNKTMENDMGLDIPEGGLSVTNVTPPRPVPNTGNQPQRAQVLDALNAAMPGMHWSDGGRTAFNTTANLTQDAARRLADTLAQNTGIQRSEIEVVANPQRGGFHLEIPDDNSVRQGALTNLRNPQMRDQIRAASAVATMSQVAPGITQDSARVDHNNIQAPQVARTNSGLPVPTVG